MKIIYCDNAASTPLAPEVHEHMLDIQQNVFGNPSSYHRAGQSARAVIEKARRQVAAAFQCEPGEIIFTSSGSEANNLILNNFNSERSGIISSTVEHSSVIHTLKQAAAGGTDVLLLHPEDSGSINPDKLTDVLESGKNNVSLMLVNNELGSITDIRSISAICRSKGVRIHTDAVQAAGRIQLDFKDLDADYLTLSAHKIYGPKGVGALIVKNGLTVNPMITGGGQEQKLRAGTENLVGIAGFGKAAELLQSKLETDIRHLSDLSSKIIDDLTKSKVQFIKNGSQTAAGILNLTFPGINGQQLMMNLDISGFAVSTGSACATGSLEPSYVLPEIGLTDSQSACTLRISFGRYNTIQEAKKLAESISFIISNISEGQN